MQNKFLKTIAVLFFLLLFVSSSPAEPIVFSPEDLGPGACFGCCDPNGNQLPSDPVCGCSPIDKCNVCNGDGTTCDCELKDCAGNPFPDSAPYCAFDVNKDSTIDQMDAQAIIGYINRSGSGAVDETNRIFDINKNGSISPTDILQINNFLNNPPSGILAVDACGICGGSGENLCGTCPGTANYVVPEGPNGICGCPNSPSYLGAYSVECDVCTKLPKDQCGRCPGSNDYNTPAGTCGCDPNIIDLGCGCGHPGPGCDQQCGTQAVIDDCGVCGGNNECKECSYYDITLWSALTHGYKSLTLRDNSLFGEETFQKIGNWKQEATVPQCLLNIMARCSVTFGSSMRGTSHDRCMFREIVKLNPNLKSNGDWVMGIDFNNPETERFVIDKNCDFSENISTNQLCGSFIVRQDETPLSLVINDSKSNSSSIVEFEIDKGSQKGNIYSIWKGSANLPLVVYDPQNLGNITSAYQLFGNWTFGGKTTKKAGISKVSLNDSINEMAHEKQRWANGYEALAFLDKNNDQEISGNELDGISLWFDENQNAISEKGEVITAKEFGITKLMTTPNKIDKDNGDLSASLGYQRLTKDGFIWGKSLDWMSTSSKTKSELIRKVTNTISLNSSSNANYEKDSVGIEKNESTGKNTNEYDQLIGVWKWKLDKAGQEIYATEGRFEFSVIEHKLVGQNFVFRPVVNKDGQLLTNIEIINLTDISYSSDEDSKKLRFKIKSDEVTSSVNTLTIDPTQKEMKGVTTLYYKDKEGKASEISYNWYAEKQY